MITTAAAGQYGLLAIAILCRDLVFLKDQKDKMVYLTLSDSHNCHLIVSPWFTCPCFLDCQESAQARSSPLQPTFRAGGKV